jgi:hypothetical protein
MNPFAALVLVRINGETGLSINRLKASVSSLQFHCDTFVHFAARSNLRFDILPWLVT